MSNLSLGGSYSILFDQRAEKRELGKLRPLLHTMRDSPMLARPHAGLYIEPFKPVNLMPWGGLR
jgi:hypothetical protein